MRRVMRVPLTFATIFFLSMSLPLVKANISVSFSTSALSPAAPPTFNISQMNASMRNAYAWAVSRTLSNGTATLGGTSNNLLSTSLVGRVLTYIQLEIGDKTSLALIQQMINAEHTLLQNPSYISFGIWPVQDHLTQLQIHRDVQKFLLRAYGLTLDQTARSDLVMVTQDIYLNMPGRFEYYDTLAWGFANAVWFAFYDGSPLPSSSDFSSAVQDLNLHYNFTAAKADSANSFVDFSRLLHYITAPEFTDGYFRLEGLSLDQSYQSVEAQLADQLITRQLPNGNVSTIKPYKSYLVEDYAKDLDSAYYLNKDAAYVLAAFKTESFLTRLYLQPNGNMSLPGRGEGLAPFVSFHLISIANDIKLSSTSSWYVALSQASRIINYTMSIQNSDGTFRFYTNSTNPGFAYTTISATAAIADSYAVLQNSGVIATSTSQSSSSVSATSQLTFSVSTTSQPTPSFSASSGGVTASSATISQSVQSTSGNHQLTQSNPAGAPLSGIPSWAYALVPILLVIVLAMAYEARHRARYRGLVDK